MRLSLRRSLSTSRWLHLSGTDIPNPYRYESEDDEDPEDVSEEDDEDEEEYEEEELEGMSQCTFAALP